MAYNDPQEVHGGECVLCHNWFADNEEGLDADDLCDDCAEEVEAEEAEQRERDAECEKPLSLAKPVKTDWLFIAGNLTGAK